MSLNIGHFVIKFPSRKERIEVYGSERITYVLCEELTKMGNKVHVFAPYSKTFIERLNGVTVRFYKSNFRLSGYNVSIEMLKDVMNYKLDVIHVHNDSPWAMFCGLKYAEKKGVPLVITWHGDWLGANTFRKLTVPILNRTFIRHCLSRADAIIVPSGEYVDQSNVLGEFRDKVEVIPHGVDLSKLHVPYSKEDCRKILRIDEDKIVVLYLSALTEAKGAGILLRAASKVLKERKDVEFIFVGGGMVEYFKRIAKELEVPARFTGYVDESEKLLYLKAADVFVFSSISKHEVFPVVTIEAAAFKLPIIVSDLKIFRSRIINGINGIFFKAGNSEDLARALLYLLDNEKLRRRIGKNAYTDIALKFNSRNMAMQTLNLYQKLLRE